MVGLARRVEKIEEIANGLVNVPGKLHAMKCDVTVYEEVENTFKLIRENIGVVQILINNAGICTFGTFTGNALVLKRWMHGSFFVTLISIHICYQFTYWH